MNFLTPTFLALAALAGPIILLYMLKLRRREVPVSSVLLWRQLLRDREANSPWQRLRRNLLLLLQLLILAMLVVALARPFIEVPSVASGSVALLLDASASMHAIDAPGGTRFEAAQAAALRVVSELAAEESMTVISVGESPRVLSPLTDDKAALRAAINGATPGQSSADWEAAFALAAAGGQGSEDFSMVVISDGGLPDDLPSLAGDIRFVPVGRSSDNLAVSALAARPTLEGMQLFAAITNYGERDAEVIFDLEVDGELFSAEEVTVPAGETADLTIVDLPPDARAIRAGLTLPADSQASDDLPLDDYAWTVYAPRSTVRTLLMTEGNLFLEQMLIALPSVEAFRAPDDGSLPEAPFDLYVFDGMLPDELPDEGNLLIINPTISNELFTVGGTFEETQITRVADTDPLLAFVDVVDLSVFDAERVEVPPWAETLIEAEGGALLFAGEQGNRRVAVLTFDLHHSDLPLQVAFPVLMSNLMAWYAPAQAFDAGDGLSPGQTLSVRPVAETTTITVEKPDGVRQRFEATSSPLVYADTDVLGLYQVTLEGENTAQGGGFFAVNLFAPEESRIESVDTITLGEAEIGAVVEEEAVGQREFWPWLALVGLLVLMIEWYVYHRGTMLPTARGAAGDASPQAGRRSLLRRASSRQRRRA
jgi:hypothetical protein